MPQVKLTVAEKCKRFRRDIINFEEKDISFRVKLSLVFCMLAIDITYTFFIIMFLKRLYGQVAFQKKVFSVWQLVTDIMKKPNFYDAVKISAKKSVWQSLFAGCLLAPIWEEYAFRIYWFTKTGRKRLKEKLTLHPAHLDIIGILPYIGTMLFTSIIFGLVHGGALNIVLQGVGGFFLAYTYLRNGHSAWSAILQHSLFNFTLILLSNSGLWIDGMAAVNLPMFWVTL
ncbi:MAG: CPBP family intramembrane glutamic endopeptidase [bacterium]